MSQWIARWNFDKGLYEPGSQGIMDFWLENTGINHLYVEKVWLKLDWQGDEAFYSECAAQIPLSNNSFLTSVRFSIPQTKAGVITYSIGLDMYEYNMALVNWTRLPPWWSKPDHFINSIPRPYYRAFISRGIRPEERVVTDPIVEMVKEWGFETTTVGIERMANPENIDEAIKQEIQTADCLIVIATRRYLDALSGMWRTLEWLHGETGIAYGLDKPLLVLVEGGVLVQGLPGYLAEKNKSPVLGFESLNLYGLRQRLDATMLPFRDWIASKKSQAFWDAVGKAVPFLVIGGTFGYALGSSRR
jgi:hypothetical protein